MPLWHRLAVVGAVLLATAIVARLLDARIARRDLDPVQQTRYRVLRRTVATAVVFVGLLSVGALALAAVPGSISFGENGDIFEAGTIQTAQSLGWGAILIGGMLSAAVMIFTTSILTLRTGALPKWSAWVGFLAAIALLFAVVFIPQIALLIWALSVSGAMLARPAVTTQAVYQTPTA